MADTCIQESMSSWDLRESEHGVAEMGPSQVFCRPAPPATYRACSSRVRCFPDTRKECGNSASVSSRTCSETGEAVQTPPPGTVGWRLMDCAQGTLQAPGTRDRRRGLAHPFLIPRSQANAPAPASLYPSGADGPGVLAAAKSAQCEVGVTVPDTWVTRNKNWVTHWAWGHSFSKSRSRA